MQETCKSSEKCFNISRTDCHRDFYKFWHSSRTRENNSFLSDSSDLNLRIKHFRKYGSFCGPAAKLWWTCATLVNSTVFRVLNVFFSRTFHLNQNWKSRFFLKSLRECIASAKYLHEHRKCCYTPYHVAAFCFRVH